MKKEIAVIGYGRFGRCAAHHLKRHFRVFASDTRMIRNAEKGIVSVSIETAANKPIVLLAVPINQMISLLKAIAPFLSPKTLVCDVCSVKEQPNQWMRKLLPPHVSILGTHPLFGPDSASESLRNRTIVLCPVRIPPPRLRHVHSLLSASGLNVLTMTPREHDRLMASTLFLTQFVGRGLLAMNLPHTTESTQHFHFLQQLVLTANNDTQELFRDMYHYNRFAHPVPKRLLNSFERAYRSLQSRNR